MVRKRLPTSKDVALAVGVSQATISRAFSSGSVSPALRARILEASEAMGYRPNVIARSLTVGRSQLVGVLISDQTSLVYPELIYGITEGLAELGYRVLLFTAQPSTGLGDIVSEILSHHVDGVITTLALERQQLDKLLQRNVPLVYFNRLGVSPMSSVYCDHAEGGRLLTEALLAAGHRTFGLLAGRSDSFISLELERGVRLALKGIDSEPVVVPTDYQYSCGATGLAQVEAVLGQLPDVMICLNDTVAAGCIDDARFARSLRVPDDMSVVGFNGRGPLMWDAYRLTTMRQPIEMMTKAAVEMIAIGVESPSQVAERRVYLPTLVDGATAKLMPSKSTRFL